MKTELANYLNKETDKRKAKESRFEKLLEANYIVLDGTSFAKMYVKATYDKLIELFGEPSEVNSPDGKVQARWAFAKYSLDVTKQKVLTIYDYKNEYPVKEINKWHVGSKNLSQDEAFKELVKLGIVKKSIDKKFVL